MVSCQLPFKMAEKIAVENGRISNFEELVRMYARMDWHMRPALLGWLWRVELNIASGNIWRRKIHSLSAITVILRPTTLHGKYYNSATPLRLQEQCSGKKTRQKMQKREPTLTIGTEFLRN